uniref:THAP-type domain-containing protein n=1 Tax=Sander lucioperca TaxID=283035 RepID=A0A8D0CTF1_SANLU
MSLFGNKAGKRLKLQHQEKKTSLHCCVPLCTNSSRYNSILSFHRFPVDEEVKSVWTAKIRREDFSPTDGTRVCSVHFLPGDFVGPRRLKKGAVPCLFAWNKFSIPAPRLNVWQRHPRPPTPELLPADTSEEEDSVQPMDVTVTDHDNCVTPNTSVVNTQMAKEDVQRTQSIARLRVHAERFIRRVKENKLFEKVIPLSISGSIDQLFSVACLLVNYQYGPLVKAWATQQ